MPKSQTHILLAEDDFDDAELFTEFLKDRNDILFLPPVINGEELLAVLKEGIVTPDVIILDHNMPKMNGLQTLEELKKNSEWAAIPVVVYSTFANEALTNKVIQAGALVIYEKPVSKEDYHEMIDDVIKQVGRLK